MSSVLVRGTVTIDAELCKGCELCVPACRPGVLRMTDHVNTQGYRLPELLAGCTACRACFEVCPDFVFEVYRYDTPIELEVTEEPATAGSGEVG
jgi:2-oxoglutarate ferredoxin oxidoreductase subunit delta